MKKIIFLLIILGCLLFCGCAATADMEYGIDSDNTAYTRLRVDVNAGDLSYSDKERVKSAMQQVARYYRDSLGFDCEFDYFVQNDSKAYITLTKSVRSESFEDAFENLKGMLCDDSLSAFSEVTCELSDTEGEYAYRINGRVDLHRVVENTYNSGIAKAVADYTAQQLENCSISVTMSLPENTEVYRLSVSEPTEISHVGEISCFKGDVLIGSAVWLRQKLFTVLIPTLGILLILLLAGMTAGVCLIKKGKKAGTDIICQSENGEYFNDQKQDQDRF